MELLQRYRRAVQDATLEDYIVIGPKDSAEASFIASKLGGDRSTVKSTSILGVEMDLYLVRGESSAA